MAEAREFDPALACWAAALIRRVQGLCIGVSVREGRRSDSKGRKRRSCFGFAEARGDQSYQPCPMKVGTARMALSTVWVGCLLVMFLFILLQSLLGRYGEEWDVAW